MPKTKRPVCFECHSRPARADSRFCSQKCAAAWADEWLQGFDDGYCPKCGEWVTTEKCDDCGEVAVRWP